MIYFDNAATTMHKPPEVVQAVTEAMCSLGNAGRGAHAAALDASRLIFDTRKKLADLFHAESPKQIVFTMNATESLNIAIKGVLRAEDHVITTALEHNSVLRPLYEMEEKGVELTILEADSQGRICTGSDQKDLRKKVRSNTRAIICTHGSNVTGNLTDIEKIGAFAREQGLLFIVDASQTAGIFPIDVQKMNIDILCFTGHKGMLGPQGSGGMYVREGLSVRPLLTGGSGVQSYSRTHPEQMPTALEAGTLNIHGIAGLGAAVDYLNRIGLDTIRQKEQELMRHFYEQIRDIPGVKIYGDFGVQAGVYQKANSSSPGEERAGLTDNVWKQRCAIVSLNIRDYDSAQVSDVLFEQYGIATRPGAHCAPLMHQALGTAEQGVVRFSFSHYNTAEEIEQAAAAIRELAKA